MGFYIVCSPVSFSWSSVCLERCCTISKAAYSHARCARVMVATFSFLAQNFDGTVYTFGFGSDHDAKMLEALSTQGGGVYYYIDSAEKVSYECYFSWCRNLATQSIVCSCHALGLQFKQRYDVWDHL